jgi:hypothetical protein
LTLDAHLLGSQNPYQDSHDRPQDPVAFDIGETQTSELKSHNSSKQKRASAASSKSEALYNKKRTFSLKECATGHSIQFVHHFSHRHHCSIQFFNLRF